MTSHPSPKQVLESFFAAERRYMLEGGSFAEFAATLADDVVLHQSPDLPWAASTSGRRATRSGHKR